MSSYDAAILEHALSTARISTYRLQAPIATKGVYGALALYAWHAEVSAAFMAPLHICEVVLRNAICEALTAVYGPQWPKHTGFQKTLPYKLQYHLQDKAASQPTTGKVIPELIFHFWETLLTARYDTPLWRTHLFSVFPNLEPHPQRHFTISRNRLNAEVGKIRALRNRIAHHEPLFKINLAEALAGIEYVTASRCRHTADWMMAHQYVERLLRNKP